MTSPIRGRLARLEKNLALPGECNAGVTVLLDAGQEPPPDAARCPRCGPVHPLWIAEELAEPGREPT